MRWTLVCPLALSCLASPLGGCGRIGYDLSHLDGRDRAPNADGAAGSLSADGAGGSVSANDAAGGPLPADGGLAAAGTSASDAASSGGALGSGGAAGQRPDSGSGTGGSLGAGGTGGRGADSGPATSGGSPSVDGGATSQAVSVTDPAQTVRSGVAQIGNGELDLTIGTRNVAGAAYLPNAYAITPTTSFTVSFSFRLYGATGSTGDGFAFLWQNDPRGTAAIGLAGGGLGYGGITPSVVVEFDVLKNSWDPANNDVAITTNGQYTTALADQAPSFGMSDGLSHHAWLDYEGSTKTLSVYLASTDVRPAAPLVSASVDLYATVGSAAYLGFTAACGVSNEYAAIESLAIEYRP